MTQALGRRFAAERSGSGRTDPAPILGEPLSGSFCVRHWMMRRKDAEAKLANGVHQPAMLTADS